MAIICLFIGIVLLILSLIVFDDKPEKYTVALQVQIE